MNLLKYKWLLCCIAINCIVSNISYAQKSKHKSNSPKNNALKTSLPAWKEGYLDIHHINTGSGDASYLVFPDGTTMIFDAGNLDQYKFEEKYKPLKASSPTPSDSLTAAQWIAAYIKSVRAKGINSAIDYGVISHFHEDHYGSFVKLAKLIPMHKVIDRDYPNYNFPLNLKKYLNADVLFQEYLSFIDSSKISVEALVPGKNNQIVLRYNPKKYTNFKVKNIKTNATIATGNGDEVLEYFKPEEMTSFYNGKYNENTLSLALKISYGPFDYYMGGDNTGLQGYGLPKWFDVETPISKAVGKVEVATLNHHGNRDATNLAFTTILDPRVVIQQSWCSDHPGQEVYQRLVYKEKDLENREIFSTNIFPETLATYGPWFSDEYKSKNGHIVVRVYQDGKKYDVYVLDDKNRSMRIIDKFGPYLSK